MQNVENIKSLSANEGKPLLGYKFQSHSSKKLKFYLNPGVFVLFFGWSISETVLVNEILVQTCYVTFNFSRVDCILLGRKNESSEIKVSEIEHIWKSKILSNWLLQYIDDEIQPYVAKVLMAKMMLEAILPAILVLFIGPLSDNFGRKPILNITCFGLFLYFSTLCIINFLSNYYNISPWYYCICFGVFSLFGGFPCILTSILSHTADSSSASKRSER